MARQRQKTSGSNQVIPEAVPKIIELVGMLRASREEVSKVGSEPNAFPSFQLLTETAARLVRTGESTFTAADKAWQLIDDCVHVHRAKRREYFRKQDDQLLKQIPQRVNYNDAVRLITEEQRIDRASDKFQRFLKYYHHGGEKVKNPEAYTTWQAAVSEYSLGLLGDLETEFSQKPGERIKEFKLDGINDMYLQYMRRVYWGWQYQQFLRVADPVEKSRSGSMGGRGKKKGDQ